MTVPTKKSIIDQRSAAKIYYPMIGVKIRRDDGDLYEAIQNVAARKGISAAEYLRIAAKEKLERDGEL